jgi:hypothetical protein
MSKARVIQFPDNYDEEVETNAFVQRFLDDMLPRALNTSAYVEAIRDFGLEAPIETLLRTTRETWQAFALLYAGLPPERQKAMAARLAPQWKTLTESMKRNRRLAKAMLGERRDG